MKDNFKEAIKSVMSMCIDVMKGGITEDTFISNLKMYISYFEANKEKPMSTQTHSYITKG